MRVEILGCAGAIGDPTEGTTSILVDEDILIDAGTGVCRLPFDRLCLIKDVFLTHVHLDHICALPLLLDAVGVLRDRPLRVHATAQTIKHLKAHIFNDLIWPDFSKLPNEKRPALEFVNIEPMKTVSLDGREFFPIPVEHTVDALGFVVSDEQRCWAFSGDTHRTDLFYNTLNQLEKLDFLIVESAFPDEEKWIADVSKHLCPQLLMQELSKLTIACEIWITHLKPKAKDLTIFQLQSQVGNRSIHILKAGTVFGVD